jgi:hypothetical protein
MDNRVKTVILKNRPQLILAKHISLVEGRSYARDLLDPADHILAGIAQIVENDNLCSLPDQLYAGM